MSSVVPLEKAAIWSSSPNTELPHFRQSMERHRNAGGEDHERADSRKQGDEPALEAEPAEYAPGEHGDEAYAGDRQRQAGAERDDEEHPEGDAVEGDRREQ